MKTEILISCIFYVFLTSNLSGTSTHVVENDHNVYRLPDTTEPISYELWIKPLVDVVTTNYTFSGRVDIVVKAKWYTTEIILNSRDLIVTSVSGFEDMKTKRLTAVNGYVYDVPNERLIIEIERTVVPRRLYKFTVEFNGILRNDFTGFHKYFYDSSDNSRWVALTHFKPIYARRAFPCYDEPRFKTSYKISVARKSRHFALSNMPLNRSETNLLSDWSWDHFEPTKPIPTYLVAFMVSDFDKNMMNNDNITIYTREEFIGDTTYMMGKAPNLLKNVEQFTQISYMLPKLDMVGIPLLNAYSLGNWGLNSYKEYYLTLSNRSLTEDEMLGTMTVLREILHQWFGNMVTNPRWDYVWLNEGICNYLNYFILDKIQPNWNLNEKFIEDVHQHTLIWDGFDDTHPLTFSVLKPNEIINVFDPITVDKSAALFRMLKNMVGETYFKKSLNKYLIDFAYAEAGPNELWEAFDYVLYEAEYKIGDAITINNTMYLWTEQAGYPLINVISSNGYITVTQERFSLSNPRDPDNTKWFVGLSYTTENNKNFDNVTSTVWLKPSEEKTVIPIPTDSGWKIFNLQSTGFYRVNYDEKNWKLLLIQLITKPDRIHVLNRAQIIDDAHHLSRVGLVSYDYYISLLEYLLMEDHVTPWNSATYGLTSIMNSIRRYPEEQLHFKEYMKHIADILYTKLSRSQFENESTKIGWSKLLTWSCKSGSSSCEKYALRYFEAWMNGENIPAEIKEATFCTGMKYGNFTVWSKMFDYYKKTIGSLSNEHIVASFACVESAETLLKYLNLMRWNDGVSSQKLKSVFVNLVTTSHGVKALASYFLNELDSILALEDGHMFASFAYSTLAAKVATDDEISIMNKIRRSVKSNDLRVIFDNKHRLVESNLKWMDRDHKKIIQAIGKIKNKND